MSTTRWLLSMSLLAVAPDAAARASVIVVDPGGGPGGAALLQAAIDGASDGDILLLKPGLYDSLPGSHPHVVDKDLVIAVDGPPGSVVLTGLEIDESSATGVLFVRGLDVAPAPFVGLPSAAVEASTEGVVWFEDCRFTGTLVSGGSQRGLYAETRKLHVVRCTVTGADGADGVPAVSPAKRGAEGAQINIDFNFRASIHDSTIRGGRGGDGDPYVAGGMFPADGGPAIFLSGAYVLSILGSTLQGGDEGDFNPPETKPGAALLVFGSLVFVRDSSLLPGAVNGAGTPQVPIEILGLTEVTEYPAPARSLSVPSPLREGEASALHIEGEAGDGVWIWLGLSASFKDFPTAQGSFLLDSLLPSPSFVGSIGGSGELDVSFNMPNLPGGMDGVVITMQSVIAPSTGGTVVGSGTALLWLDASL